ncbi:DUF4186 family protein [Salinisphaera orenii]|uniref:DUF4186 domain-containing protein n=1 Tax=Salinisphaera orenii YIM 95161 TaxID=1051139 RepID=A0A423PT77_9GAMM|nr:DUF4186 family protein [Salinisphaera halophila]ROO28805.1 hypothetical protein SAHL_09675 [Salinisphaera halophila YIM 95161]
MVFSIARLAADVEPRRPSGYPAGMRDLDDLFAGLARSRFRRRFALGRREADYLAQRGLDAVLAHGAEFVADRLAPARPANDGRQTPWRNHPIFVAQHATGTCCRTCLARWHRIPAERALSAREQAYVLAVIARWLRGQPEAATAPRQPDLFRD